MEVRRTLGTVISWLALVAESGFLLAFTAWILQPLIGWRAVIKLSVISFIVAAVGHWAFGFGRRLAQSSAPDVLAHDRRPLVLLLRAFSADGEIAETNWLRQDSLVAWMVGRATFEEQVSCMMENLGPTVALGRGDELVPTSGFARDYAGDRVWRQALEEYLSRAGWVVILLYRITPSLVYEITEVLRSGRAWKILLIPPPGRFRTPGWQVEYDSLAGVVADLPAIGRNTAAVVYDGEGEGPHPITMAGNHSSGDQLRAIHRALIPKYLSR